MWTVQDRCPDRVTGDARFLNGQSNRYARGMSRRLYLVRHAMPVVDPDTVSSQWRLDAAGEAAAAELIRSLPDGEIH